MQESAQDRNANQTGQEDAWASDCGGVCLPAFFEEIERRMETPLLKRAMGVLRQNPYAFVAVGEWAGAIGVSREHLTRAISPIISPHALLQAARVSVALSRLANQERLRAGEALDAMGYNSRAHAFAVFKKTTGASPTEYWTRLQNHDHGEACAVATCPLLGAVIHTHEIHKRKTGG